jgi:hypothetical protein
LANKRRVRWQGGRMHHFSHHESPIPASQLFHITQPHFGHLKIFRIFWNIQQFTSYVDGKNLERL